MRDRRLKNMPLHRSVKHESPNLKDHKSCDRANQHPEYQPQTNDPPLGRIGLMGIIIKPCAKRKCRQPQKITCNPTKPSPSDEADHIPIGSGNPALHSVLTPFSSISLNIILSYPPIFVKSHFRMVLKTNVVYFVSYDKIFTIYDIFKDQVVQNSEKHYILCLFLEKIY